MMGEARHELTQPQTTPPPPLLLLLAGAAERILCSSVSCAAIESMLGRMHGSGLQQD